MEKISVFIDGFNLYHSLNDNPALGKYKWLNYFELAKMFVTSPNQELTNVLLFTSYATWNPGKVNRHKKLIKVSRFYGVQIVYGKFYFVTKTCLRCHRTYDTHEEKQTDVNICTKLFELAINNEYDTALILSGDSDLVPPIKSLKTIYPTKKFGIIIPPGRKAKELKNICNPKYEITQQHLIRSQLQDSIEIKPKVFITKPPEWS